MNSIDRSLDDIIKQDREKKRQRQSVTSKTAPEAPAGIQTKSAAIRTQKLSRGAKTSSPYAVSKPLAMVSV